MIDPRSLLIGVAVGAAAVLVLQVFLFLLRPWVKAFFVQVLRGGAARALREGRGEVRKGKALDTVDDKPRYFDDDGTEMNPDLVAKPSLCVSCAKDEDPDEEMLCNLNRLDQQGEDDFRCGAYEPRKGMTRCG